MCITNHLIHAIRQSLTHSNWYLAFTIDTDGSQECVKLLSARISANATIQLRHTKVTKSDRESLVSVHGFLVGIRVFYSANK